MRNRLLHLLFIAGLLVALVISVIPAPASADPSQGPAASGTWIDHSDITIAKNANFAGGKFHDGETDDNLNYSIQGASGCASKDYIDGWPGGSGSQAKNATAHPTLHIYGTPGGTNVNCVELTDEKVNLGDTANFSDYFVWADAGTIARSDTSSNLVFLSQNKKTPQGDLQYLATGDGKCRSEMDVASAGAGSGYLSLSSSSSDGIDIQEGWPSAISSQYQNNYNSDGQGCYDSQLDIPVNIADPIVTVNGKPEKASDIKAGTSNAAQIPNNQQSGGSGSTAGPSINCSVSVFNPLSWFLCPLAVGLEDVASGLDTEINHYLTINTAGWQGQSNNYYKAWATVRDISLGLLVIAGLLAIISQAAGFEFLDAYTIRKALPRIVIVAIGITVAWPLLQVFVKFTNDLGNDVASIIGSVAPGNVQLGGGGEAVIALISAGGIVALGFVGLLSFAGTAALAASVAFLVLTLRQMIILILVIFSPIALICYVLPNTQRIWKLWWESFSKGLLMFPIIAAFIAAGRVFAAITSENGGSVDQVLAFVAYFAPYFFIPFTFRLAGGAISTIGGFVNDRHRGAFDGLKNFRGNRSKQRRANAAERITTGNTFKRAPEGTLRSRLNRGIEGTARIGQAGFNPRNWRSNVRTGMFDAAESHVGKFGESAEAQAIFGDDDQIWAAKHSRREDIEAELVRRNAAKFGGAQNAALRHDTTARILRAQHSVGNETFQRARIRAQAKTGTGYRDANGEFNAALMMQDINDAYGADRSGAGRALAEMRSSLANSGQIAGLAGYGTWAGQMDSLYKGTATAQVAHETVMDDAADSISPSQALYGKPDSARAIGAAHARRIQAIADGIHAGTHTEDDLSAAMASAAGIYDAMAQASPQNASAMANELMGVTLNNGPALPPSTIQQQRFRANGQPEVDANGHAVYDTVTIPGKAAGTATIREYVQSQMGGNKEFVDRRRDFSQATYAQALQQQAAAQGGGPGGMPNPGGPGGMPNPGQP